MTAIEPSSNKRQQAFQELSQNAETIKSNQGRRFVLIKDNKLEITNDPKKETSLKKVNEFMLSQLQNVDTGNFQVLKKSYVDVIKSYPTKFAQKLYAGLRKIIHPDSVMGKAIAKVISGIDQFFTIHFRHDKEKLINEFNLRAGLYFIKPEIRENAHIKAMNLEQLNILGDLITQQKNLQEKKKLEKGDLAKNRILNNLIQLAMKGEQLSKKDIDEALSKIVRYEPEVTLFSEKKMTLPTNLEDRSWGDVDGRKKRRSGIGDDISIQENLKKIGEDFFEDIPEGTPPWMQEILESFQQKMKQVAESTPNFKESAKLQNKWEDNIKLLQDILEDVLNKVETDQINNKLDAAAVNEAIVNQFIEALHQEKGTPEEMLEEKRPQYDDQGKIVTTAVDSKTSAAAIDALIHVLIDRKET